MASTDPPRLGEIHANESWHESLSLLGSEEAEIMIRPISSRFSGRRGKKSEFLIGKHFCLKKNFQLNMKIFYSHANVKDGKISS